jgi:hypothetical protein
MFNRAAPDERQLVGIIERAGRLAPLNLCGDFGVRHASVNPDKLQPSPRDLFKPLQSRLDVRHSSPPAVSRAMHSSISGPWLEMNCHIFRKAASGPRDAPGHMRAAIRQKGSTRPQGRFPLTATTGSKACGSCRLYKRTDHRDKPLIRIEIWFRTFWAYSELPNRLSERRNRLLLRAAVQCPAPDLRVINGLVDGLSRGGKFAGLRGGDGDSAVRAAE